MIIAQHFSAGRSPPKNIAVRETDGSIRLTMSVVHFTDSFKAQRVIPALKCWAIFSRPASRDCIPYSLCKTIKDIKQHNYRVVGNPRDD